jgi:hypothetical protein
MGWRITLKWFLWQSGLPLVARGCSQKQVGIRGVDTGWNVINDGTERVLISRAFRMAWVTADSM